MAEEPGQPPSGAHAAADDRTGRGAGLGPGGRLALVVLLLALVGWLVASGELGTFLLAGLEIGPFIVLAVLAQLGERRTWARVLTYVWLGLLVAGTAVLVLTLSVLASPAASGEGGGLAGRSALALAGSALLASTILLRPTRVWLARRLPIDPDSLAHQVALAFLTFFVGASFAQLALLGGEPPLLRSVARLSDEELTGGRSDALQILGFFYSLAWMLPLAVAAAGYPIRRSLAGSLARLGLTRLGWRQVGVGLGLAALLVLAFWAIDAGIAWTWEQLGWPQTDEELFKRLLGAGMTPVGALAIGVTAGLGEEATVRGLLQPRLGLLLPNLAFVAAHAFQYGPDALLSVFLMGLALAVVRARSSTTVAALVHGGYNTFAIGLDLLGL